MSTEIERLSSRLNVVAGLKVVVRRMLGVERMSEHLPRRLQRDIENMTSRVMLLQAKVEKWPVTADERFKARQEKLAKKIREANHA